MKRPLLSIGILALMTVAVFASERFTAISSLRSFGVERGQRELSRVVGMVGFYGQDQPVQWLVLTVDPQAPALLHEYVVRQGRVVAERHFERDPEQDLPYIPLSMGSLKIDSDRAFVIAEVAARRAGIGFDSIHYQLRCRDLRNEPVWVLNLIDQEKAIVGALYVSAVTGETLRAVWHRPGTRDYSQVNEGPGLFTRLTDKIGNGIANLRGKNNNPQPAPNPAMAAPAR